MPFSLPNPVPPGLVYLALPYTSSDPGVAAGRMEGFWKAASELIDGGVHIVSGMSMEPTKAYSARQNDWDNWQAYCESLIDAANEVWVLMLPGWEESAGVAGEVAHARAQGKRVRYVDIAQQLILDSASADAPSVNVLPNASPVLGLAMNASVDEVVQATNPPGPHLALADIEPRANGAPSQLLSWVPKTPFTLAADCGMPWQGWNMDRVLAWVGEEGMELFDQGVTANAALACVNQAHSSAFDGELAFIPQSHAEHFWQFLVAYMGAGVHGKTQFQFEGHDIELDEGLLDLGESTLGIYGMTTARGLWLVFSESDASFGTPLISEAVLAYPQGEQLRLMDAQALGVENSVPAGFDYSRAWAALDSHLANNLRPTRASATTCSAFYALLAGAIEDGALPLSCLDDDLEGQPWEGQRVALAGALTHDAGVIAALVARMGGTMVEGDGELPSLLIAGEQSSREQAAAERNGTTVLDESKLAHAVLSAHVAALENREGLRRTAPGARNAK